MRKKKIASHIVSILLVGLFFVGGISDVLAKPVERSGKPGEPQGEKFLIGKTPTVGDREEGPKEGQGVLKEGFTESSSMDGRPVFYFPRIAGINSWIKGCKRTYLKWISYLPDKDERRIDTRCKGVNGFEVTQSLFLLDHKSVGLYGIPAGYTLVNDFPKIGRSSRVAKATINGKQKYFINFLKGYASVIYMITAAPGIDLATIGLSLARQSESAIPESRYDFNPETPVDGLTEVLDPTQMARFIAGPNIYGNSEGSGDPLKKGTIKNARISLQALAATKPHVYLCLSTVGNQDVPFVAAIRGQTGDYNMFFYSLSSKECYDLGSNIPDLTNNLNEADIWLVFQQVGVSNPVAFKSSYRLSVTKAMVDLYTIAGANLLVTPDKKVIFPPPALYIYSDKSQIDARIENYRELIRRFPQQRFFVYFHERIAYSKYHPFYTYYKNSDGGRSFNYFKNNLPQGLVLGNSFLSSFENYAQNYFWTDHHWNIRGAWQAYEAIYQMLAPNYPGISTKLNVKRFWVIPGVNFLGSYAKETTYPVPPEVFEIADVDMPPYEIYVNNTLSEYNRRDEYLAGHFSTAKYANHYGLFYGYARRLVEYRFQNQATRNLLIIGSSFTRPMQMYVAAHYRSTYIIDLRYNADFSLGKAIGDYDIDDILVIGDIIAYQSPTWAITP